MVQFLFVLKVISFTFFSTAVNQIGITIDAKTSKRMDDSLNHGSCFVAAYFNGKVTEYFPRIILKE
jgi:hypothetical protein